MSLPNVNDLKGLAFALNGEPFVQVPASASVNTKALCCALNGEPFIGASWPSSTGNFFFFF